MDHGPIDDSGWPVVVVVLDETVDAAAAEEVVGGLDAVLDRRERFGIVFDYGRGTPAAQQRVGGWLAEQVDALRALVVAGVTVVPADRVEHVQAMIATGAFPMPFEAWATATVDEGVAWVRARMEPEAQGS